MHIHSDAALRASVSCVVRAEHLLEAPGTAKIRRWSAPVLGSEIWTPKRDPLAILFHDGPPKTGSSWMVFLEASALTFCISARSPCGFIAFSTKALETKKNWSRLHCSAKKGKVFTKPLVPLSCRQSHVWCCPSCSPCPGAGLWPLAPGPGCLTLIG